MGRQIKYMTKLELCNLYGINKLRFSKDKKAKRRNLLLLAAWILVIAVLVVYVGAFAYLMCSVGLQDVVPAYLITIASLMIFFFGIFKAGSSIFQKNGYEILCSLPVSQIAIVTSRLLRMYIEELLLTLAIMVPGIAVYAWYERPGFMFYLTSLVCVLAIPVLPIAGAVVIGAFVTAIASRMKYKSLAASALTVGAVLLIMVFSSELTVLEGNLTIELLRGISQWLFSVLEKVYPPAVWLGRAMIQAEFLRGLFFMAVFGAAFIIEILLISSCFQVVCRGLYSNSAKHNYQMKELKKTSVTMALCKREFKRYFSSSIYVSNTIIGPLMGVVLSAAILAVGQEKIALVMMLPIDIFAYVPFVIAGIFCMMTTTSVSLSMEGKNWWIVKSLPLSTREILDGKILMNLILIPPFWVASEILLLLALKPEGLELLWMVLIPLVLIVFSCVYGITINLHLLVTDWENEAAVVKQSAASLIGGMGGALLAVVFAVLVAFLPVGTPDVKKAAGCVLLLAAAAFLYWKNNRVKLETLS